MKKILFFVLMFCASATIKAQYNMANSTVTTCSGTFLDNGGAGNYSANQNLTMTFCSDSSTGSHISVHFNTFDINSTGDILCIYDGNSTAGTAMGCNNNLTSLANVTVTASDNNPSGCLTFVFTSDGSTQATGWSAAISCRSPCQSLLANVVNTVPPISPDTTLDICPGEAVTITATGNYLNNNTYYHQSDSSSWFSWKFGDGDTLGGYNQTTVSHVYTQAGGYNVALVIRDTLSCISTNNIEIKVRTSTQPTFGGTHANANTMCQGDTISIQGHPRPTTWNGVPTTVTGSVYLPDGTGTSYQTSINYTIFQPGQTLTNINDLLGICMTMEHSYLGDLKMEIYCPNGQHVTLKDYPGGSSCFLGKPIDDDGCTVAGQGLEYCFKPGATTYGTMLNTTGMFNETYTIPGAGCNPSSYSYTNHEYLPAGDYQSQNPLTGLVGCPLNGNWSIKITDNLASDNGYIFAWSLYLNPALYPGVWNFTPHFDSLAWSGLDIISTSAGDSTISISPTTTGAHTYTFTAYDNFGCSYDTTINVMVNPSPGSLFSATPGTICNTETAMVTYLDTPVSGAVYTWNFAGGTASPGTGVGTHTVSWTTPGVKIITLSVSANGCTADQTRDTVIVNEMPASTFTATPTPICTGENATITYSATQIAGSLPTWNFDGATVVSGSGFGPYTLSWNTEGSKTLTLSVTANGCTSPLSTHTIIVNALPTSTFTVLPTTVCAGDTVMAAYSGSQVAGAVYNWSFASGSVTPGGNLPGPHKIVWTTSGTKNITLQVTANGCASATTTIPATVNPMPTSPFSANPIAVCTGQTSTITYLGSPVIAGATYNWDFGTGATALPGGQVEGPHAVSWATSGTKDITLTVAANGCTSTQTVHAVTVNLLPTSAFVVNPNPICDGDTVEVTYTGVSGPSSTFAWDFGGGISVPGVGAGPHRVHWINLGIKNITLTVTETAQCVSNPTNISVVINPKPTIQLAATTEVCANASANISYTGTCNTSGTCLFDWHNFNGGNVVSGSGEGPYQVAWSVAEVKNILLTLTDANGCTNSADTAVNVLPLPDLNFTADKTEGCDPLVVKFTDNTTPPPNTYNWNLGNGSSYTSCCPQVTYPTGTYDISLTVTDAKQCSKTATYPHFIKVHPMPDAQFDALPETGGPNFPIQFNSTSTGDVTSWLWNYGDQTIVDASANVEHPYNAPGIYTVWLTAKTNWQCADSVSKEIKIVDVTIPNVFTPNGDGKNDKWFIEGNQFLVDTKVLIYNRWGKKVYESNNYKNDWDGGNSTDGVYYYIVNFKNDMFKSQTGFFTILTGK